MLGFISKALLCIFFFVFSYEIISWFSSSIEINIDNAKLDYWLFYGEFWYVSIDYWNNYSEFLEFYFGTLLFIHFIKIDFKLWLIVSTPYLKFRYEFGLKEI